MLQIEALLLIFVKVAKRDQLMRHLSFNNILFPLVFILGFYLVFQLNTVMADNSQSPKFETATLAGGCFWGVEELIRQLPGVNDTEVGYTGGNPNASSYEEVKTGQSGQAESVKISFDPTQISYEEILLYFFRLHDPTTLNQQGNDRGTQYRSAIFFHSDAQRATAERVIAQVNASGKWQKPVVTQVVPAGKWNPAESYHQDYLQKHPNGYTCHYLRD